ncbi:MAG: NYN domain-containing protein [Candidatus Symbiothrix sp.]|jgi:uncharacterized LabA/DUF88 family protein|nr:NYN domain-containing protein [Candidatus Symbiothrix sp.]
MENKKQKVIIYVDGFNFYYGLKSKGWRKYYWLNVVSFFERLLKPYQELVEVNYFSARPTDIGKNERQNTFFSANLMNNKFKLYLGKYLKKEIKCKYCNQIIHTFEEKETDVRIATQILSDAFNKRCDISILCSADSDLVPPIEKIKEIDPFHKVFVFFPPDRFSSNLYSLASATKHLGGAKMIFDQCILPNKLVGINGYTIEKPIKWK